MSPLSSRTRHILWVGEWTTLKFPISKLYCFCARNQRTRLEVFVFTSVRKTEGDGWGWNSLLPTNLVHEPAGSSDPSRWRLPREPATCVSSNNRRKKFRQWIQPTFYRLKSVALINMPVCFCSVWWERQWFSMRPQTQRNGIRKAPKRVTRSRSVLDIFCDGKTSRQVLLEPTLLYMKGLVPYI